MVVIGSSMFSARTKRASLLPISAPPSRPPPPPAGNIKPDHALPAVSSPSSRSESPALDLESTGNLNEKDGLNLPEFNINRWKDSDRRKLSEEGYRTLAILATFMAAVQSQLLTSSFVGGDSTSSQAVTTLWICGLFADLLGAVLNYGSARWFEMLTPSEAKYLQQCWVAAEEGRGLPKEHPPEFTDRWVAVSVKMGYYAGLLGFISLVAGMLVWVWTQHLQLVFRILSTIVCVFFAAFIPPFACRHNRMAALSLVRLRRQSG